MKQIYSNYTNEDQEVWQILFDRQLEKLPEKASSEFLKGMNRISFNRDAIPNFDDTNKILNDLTGWSIYAVPGIVDDKVFFELLSQRKFPATTWIRKKSQLDYLEEPDMFHDVFAHVPLLTNKSFCEFLESLSKIALNHTDDPVAIHLLSRIYWYTVEFGLIDEEGKRRIYGAGILSSSGETDYSLSQKPQHLGYRVSEVFESEYRKDVYQTKYFVIDSYEALYHSIPLISKELDKRLQAVIK